MGAGGGDDDSGGGTCAETHPVAGLPRPDDVPLSGEAAAAEEEPAGEEVVEVASSATSLRRPAARSATIASR